MLVVVFWATVVLTSSGSLTLTLRARREHILLQGQKATYHLCTEMKLLRKLLGGTVDLARTIPNLQDPPTYSIVSDALLDRAATLKEVLERDCRVSLGLVNDGSFLGDLPDWDGCMDARTVNG